MRRGGGQVLLLVASSCKLRGYPKHISCDTYDGLVHALFRHSRAQLEYRTNFTALLVFFLISRRCIGSSLPRMPPPAGILLESSPNIRLPEEFLRRRGE